ncbi:GNAT family N-acetyltransferase [Parasphingorhabdus sp.]|uniref:GNAT family N-acetyltransferase n=1 Tax=Parasphingorhabdus sp. TaxID=2709688 RepID=UPI003001DC23
MSVEDVPKGKVATIITHLEMRERPQLPDTRCDLELTRWRDPSTAEYRALFRQVGEPWLWISRLLMAEEELQAILEHPAVEISVVRDKQQPAGFIELDFRVPGECEIAFFGLVPEQNGKGRGRWLMAEALKMAWRDGVERVWLHTCTQDSPRALPFYQRCGFRIFRQQSGQMDDPRLSGHLPRTAAPHIPILS